MIQPSSDFVRCRKPRSWFRSRVFHGIRFCTPFSPPPIPPAMAGTRATSCQSAYRNPPQLIPARPEEPKTILAAKVPTRTTVRHGSNLRGLNSGSLRYACPLEGNVRLPRGIGESRIGSKTVVRASHASTDTIHPAIRQVKPSAYAIYECVPEYLCRPTATPLMR